MPFIPFTELKSTFGDSLGKTMRRNVCSELAAGPPTTHSTDLLGILSLVASRLLLLT